MRFLSWLLGLEQVTSIEDVDLSFSAAWAVDTPFWGFFGSLCLLVLSALFYVRFQQRGSLRGRIALAACRGLLLVLLFLTLAGPVLKITSTNVQPPKLFFLIDGTDSMRITDQYTPQQRQDLLDAAGLEADDSPPGKPLSRLDLVTAMLRRETDNLLDRLQNEKQYRLGLFVFDGAASKLRQLNPRRGRDAKIQVQAAAEQLAASAGQVTALGNALDDVRQQMGAGDLSAVVLISDFDHNSGMSPLGNRQSPAMQLGLPIYTVGVGATEAVDVAVSLETDPKMKRDERTSIRLKLIHSGLPGEQASLVVTAHQLSGEQAAEAVEVGRQSVPLNGQGMDELQFPFTPRQAGRFEFVAEVTPLAGEVVEQNNRASREVTIIDDYLRLMYVAHEPTWEWRFIKEVFHRDTLIGMQGFRTYLSSSDPRVRQTNILFMPTLTPKRSEFFANDVIFLGDMPRSSLSSRFCEMLQEYVGEHGGGLVVICGPRFGPRELIGTPLANMLPVILDPQSVLRDDSEFAVRLTPHAQRYSFMRLGESEEEDARAWQNLGRLPWYQGVAALQEKAYALAEHPRDTCRDGRTPQPLIAIRRYGKGEVVFLGFNEMWRLRRKFGERYYSQFWSQLIYRLGMSHALGADKRFRPTVDSQQYRVDDTVRFTIEAYDEDYEPLAEDDLPQRTLSAELLLPAKRGQSPQAQTIDVPLLRQGVFETSFPVYVPGEHAIRVTDPVTGIRHERRFRVVAVNAERRRAVRDVHLQNSLSQQTGGGSYDLTTASRLADDLSFEPRVETIIRSHVLWNTPVWFAAVVLLMLGEWFSRKIMNLT